MNDVLNSQGYTQAAWWNRIPLAAWILMGVIAIFSSLLIGNNSHKTRGLLFLFCAGGIRRILPHFRPG